MKMTTLLRWIWLWPPYLGAGVRVRNVSSDVRSLDVEMRLRFWNRNYYSTHFGGSLYSMVDPFFVLMLAANLGRGYVVWDKAATIRFKAPGRGRVTARFALSGEAIDAIRRDADAGKVEPRFQVEIKDEAGTVIAEVEKVLHVRRAHPKP
jgi:hypothetical protein